MAITNCIARLILAAATATAQLANQALAEHPTQPPNQQDDDAAYEDDDTDILTQLYDDIDEHLTRTNSDDE